jgi:hypothetical protein
LSLWLPPLDSMDEYILKSYEKMKQGNEQRNWLKKITLRVSRVGLGILYLQQMYLGNDLFTSGTTSMGTVVLASRMFCIYDIIVCTMDLLWYNCMWFNFMHVFK